MKKKVTYLSGALRVSTHPKALTYGPRNHVLGILEGFKENQWETESFIAGDFYSSQPSQKQFSEFKKQSKTRGHMIDFIRMSLNQISKTIVKWKPRYRCNLVYERYGLFQNIGAILQGPNTPWIVESNEVFAMEAKNDRDSLELTTWAREHEKKNLPAM